MPLLSQHNNSIKLRNNKQNQLLHEYQQNLQYSPSHYDQNNKSPRKFNNISPTRQNLDLNIIINQLKIKVADKQFELKKLEEDHSMQINSVIKDLQKQKNQKKQVIKEWKEKLDEEMEYWKKKLELVKEEYEGKLKYNQNQVNTSIEAKLLQQRNGIETKFTQQINKITQILQQTKEVHHSQIQNLKNQHSSAISTLQATHTLTIQTLKSQLLAEIQTLKLTHSKQILFYHQLQESKSKQSKAVERIFTNKIKELEYDLGKKNQEIKQIKLQKFKQEREIDQLKKDKDQFRLDNVVLERKFNKLEKELLEQYEEKAESLKETYQNQYSQQLNKFQSQLRSIQTLFQQTTSNYQNELTLAQNRSQILLTTFNTSKSKQSDIRQIQNLQTQLLRKEIQLQKQREDLKTCKLELTNMDQLFQKMFQEAKLKSSIANKNKKLRLPSLMTKIGCGTSGINRSTMDVYQNNINNGEDTNCINNKGDNVGQKKKQRKFSIRDYSYQSMAKQVKEFKNQIQNIYDI